MAANLFLCNLTDIFAIYPKIFRELIANQVYYEQVFLPSDVDWQDRMYFMLLEEQKNINEALEKGKNYEDVIRQEDKPIFDSTHIHNFTPSSPPNGVSSNLLKCTGINLKSICNKSEKVLWSLEDLCKAAQLLKKPPEKVNFANEYDMRKAYSLVYDVFRCKFVLKNALDDVKFFEQYPEFSNNKNVAWLMLYDLHEREFNERSSECAKQQQIVFEKTNLKDIADKLWTLRTRIAASISKMRIKYRALHLSQLLPTHLQNEKVAKAAKNPIVTGWINPFLIRDKDAAENLLLKYGFSLSEAELDANQYKWDNMCPLFLSCVPIDRGEFSASDLVSKNYFIMQDRTFVVGPAVMARLLNFFDLNGDIVQTHINSPRSTAYLASLFYSVNKINKFYVYGSGSNLKNFRNYMEDLCIYNIRLFAESFTSFPLESNRFRTVVGVFANPPNSFSAIPDPIDFVCSRGGDLEMLEMLTESSLSNDGKIRTRLVLEQQLLTLRMAMSRSQVQFVLYQTHSAVKSENHNMVAHSIETFNKTALKKHRDAFIEKKRLELTEDGDCTNLSFAASNANLQRKQKSLLDSQNAREFIETLKQDNAFEELKLPEIDQFICVDLPDVCKNQDKCLKTWDTGCFLSLIKRKKITQLNAKYLIQTAEKRGLFGKSEGSKMLRSKPLKSQEEKAMHLNVNVTVGENSNNLMPQTNAENGKSSELIKTSFVMLEKMVPRLETPTKASKFRSNLDKLSQKAEPVRFNYKNRKCSRQGKIYVSIGNYEMKPVQG